MERPLGRVNGAARTTSVPPREQDQEHGTIDVPKTDPKDTLGAGDVFHGALTAALAEDTDLVEAITRAVHVASTRVSSVGPRAWLSLVP